VREQKIGYAEEGAKLAVNAEAVSKTGCPAGWYELIGGGFVCGKDGTLNPNDERAKFPPRQPNLDAILPYIYARNAHNGTPLYRSVPSREQIRTYEPYLFKDEQKKQPQTPAPVASTKPADVEADEATRKAREEQKRRTAAMRLAMLGPEAARKLEEEERREGKSVAVSAQVPASGTDTDGGAPPQWWQQEDPKLHELKLADLHAEGDDVLSKRMVKGFYIAVERQFGWSGRQWYRSTSGGIAPVDRFYQAAASEFRGVELSESMQLPIAWPYGHAKTKPKYTLDAELTTARSAGVVKRLEAIALTGKRAQIGKATYLEAVDGYWVKLSDVRVTEPGPPPADLAPDERWIDVNLKSQSVVLFRGTTPLYATLISSGKESTVKEKDHRTPVGEYRIREKHITATMDGDGSAAGDLPYSIEAVPYVMYYQGSYALHGAFWHSNYGVRMSHGCVNLSPLDAKYLFFNSDPPVPPGWAGTWSLADRPGSRVVVHE
jgi:lipoprotein-anchoring transpeptidase ErfK/SrfK